MQLSLDPIAMRALMQAPAERDALMVAADVAVVVIALAIVALAALVAWLLLQARKEARELRANVLRSFGPVSDRMRAISDNVEFITDALRTDVQRLNASVRALTDRLHQASERMEERIEEFNALMEVVQGEAEDIFIDTASTVRGVREGARSIAVGSQRSENPTANAAEPLAPRER